MKKQVGALEAAKFIQVESYFQTAIRSEVQDAIPLIGEIDRTKKQKSYSEYCICIEGGWF
jgi:hypothetical protein